MNPKIVNCISSLLERNIKWVYIKKKKLLIQHMSDSLVSPWRKGVCTGQLRGCAESVYRERVQECVQVCVREQRRSEYRRSYGLWVRIEEDML